MFNAFEFISINLIIIKTNSVKKGFRRLIFNIKLSKLIYVLIYFGQNMNLWTQNVKNIELKYYKRIFRLII